MIQGDGPNGLDNIPGRCSHLYVQLITSIFDSFSIFLFSAFRAPSRALTKASRFPVVSKHSGCSIQGLWRVLAWRLSGLARAFVPFVAGDRGRGHANPWAGRHETRATAGDTQGGIEIFEGSMDGGYFSTPRLLSGVRLCAQSLST
jgi:hypothetical protein